MNGSWLVTQSLAPSVQLAKTFQLRNNNLQKMTVTNNPTLLIQKVFGLRSVIFWGAPQDSFPVEAQAWVSRRAPLIAQGRLHIQMCPWHWHQFCCQPALPSGWLEGIWMSGSWGKQGALCVPACFLKTKKKKKRGRKNTTKKCVDSLFGQGLTFSINS